MDDVLNTLKKKWVLLESASKIKKKYVETTSENIEIYIVDGHDVRMNFDVDFIGGGHHYAYPEIPKNEIWLENLSPKSEIKYILVHEMIERLLMKHDKLKYSNAHIIANKYEKKIRDGQNPQNVFKKFIDEYFKNDKNSEEYYNELVNCYTSFKI